MVEEPRVLEVLPVVVVLKHGDRLQAASDRDVVASALDHPRGDRDRVEARRAEAAHGRSRHRRREAGHDRDGPPYILPLRPFREARAEDDVVDLGGVDRGYATPQLPYAPRRA